LAGFRQERRRRLAGDAAANDADPQGLYSPPFTTRHWPLT
jgi:hypothetical protein